MTIHNPAAPPGIVSHYQSQPWLMERNALEAFVRRLGSLPAASQLLQIAVSIPKRELAVAGGIATIPIHGVLLDSVPGWMRLWGFAVTGYDEIAEQAREAAAREDVTRIELAVDSPGGMVAGVMDAAAAIYAARQAKPVNAVIRNLGASGAYWLASQAERIEAADANTLAGSIGVYTWFIDWTGAEDKAGIKVIVVRSGEHKGMGLDRVTEQQIAAVQQYIDDTAANFITAVARGRGREKDSIAELATGQLWIAARAEKLGLIDAVAEPGQNTQTSTRITGDNEMDGKQKQDLRAEEAEIEQEKLRIAGDKIRLEEQSKLHELKAAFPDDLAYAVEAFEKGLSVEQAKAAYCDVLRGRLKEKAKNTTMLASTAGAEPLPSGESDGVINGADFLEQARTMAAEQKISVTAAMKKLRRQNPQLHQAFLDQARRSA